MEASTPRRTQQQRRETTRQRVLDAALATLMEKGYAGTSTWAICETGGFSKGTLLYHFKQRHQIFEALMEELTTQSLTSLKEAIEVADPRERRRAFLDWLWSTTEGDFFALGLEILTAARSDPELRKTVRAGADQLITLIDNVIDEAVEGMSKLDAKRMTAALQTSVHLVRGIGLDLAIGGDMNFHRKRFEEWRDTLLYSFEPE